MPAVARIGDKDATHCSTPIRAQGSSDVFANGRAVCRVGDRNNVHMQPGGNSCVPHSAAISAGSGTVFVNGIAMARVGDPVSGCTVVVQGSNNVFAG